MLATLWALRPASGSAIYYPRGTLHDRIHFATGSSCLSQGEFMRSAETLIRVPLLIVGIALQRVWWSRTLSLQMSTEACGEVALNSPPFADKAPARKNLKYRTTLCMSSKVIIYPLLSSVKWTVLKCIKNTWKHGKHGSAAVALSRWGAVLCLNPNGNHNKCSLNAILMPTKQGCDSLNQLKDLQLWLPLWSRN